MLVEQVRSSYPNSVNFLLKPYFLILRGISLVLSRKIRLAENLNNFVTYSWNYFILAIMIYLLFGVVILFYSFYKLRKKVTRRLFPCEIWSVFYNLARPVANSLVDGWKRFSSAQVQGGWVPHVYLGTGLLPFLFLQKASWLIHKVENTEDWIFFFPLPFRGKKKRQDSYWDFCLRGCICLATWRHRESKATWTSLSYSWAHI